ncbi:hypothetical protein ACFQ78_41090 [Streptomyces sp. NPDC056519]|uniref:hypothetical protein n=1 Tax=Streptomyces sp. NPDC056519 TaxID=3345849 RepID=UPI00368E1F05
MSTGLAVAAAATVMVGTAFSASAAEVSGKGMYEYTQMVNNSGGVMRLTTANTLPNAPFGTSQDDPDVKYPDPKGSSIEVNGKFLYLNNVQLQTSAEMLTSTTWNLDEAGTQVIVFQDSTETGKLCIVAGRNAASYKCVTAIDRDTPAGSDRESVTVSRR